VTVNVYCHVPTSPSVSVTVPATLYWPTLSGAPTVVMAPELETFRPAFVVTVVKLTALASWVAGAS